MYEERGARDRELPGRARDVERGTGTAAGASAVARGDYPWRPGTARTAPAAYTGGPRDHRAPAPAGRAPRARAPAA